MELGQLINNQNQPRFAKNERAPDNKVGKGPHQTSGIKWDLY